MTSHGNLLTARLLLAFALTVPACTRGAPPGRVIVELRTVENVLDDSQRTGCTLQEEVEAGTTHDAWISFGDVEPDAERGWKVRRTRVHCGRGPFAKSSSQFGRMLGTPYVILDLDLIPTVPTSARIGLNVSLKVHTLSGFDQEGRPLYRDRVDNRSVTLGPQGEAVFPVLIPDDRERDAFGVHEALLRVRATTAGHTRAAAYGAISVRADVPGADVLVDGGVVGRITEGHPTIVNNLVVGKREVRVRDFSDREARAEVAVEQNRVVEVALPVLQLPPSGAQTDFVPIGKNPQGYEEYWRPKDAAIVVTVPAGEFLMGSSDTDSEANQRPQHTVYLSEFRIDKTEVTWRQFGKFTADTGTPPLPAPIYGTPDDYAVSNVLWDEAMAYCKWVGGRLPTEAEWEKAARGTDGRRYPWGNDWQPGRCNSFEGGPHRPESVGRYRDCLSPYGVLDLAGGVWEWCADWYGEKYYADSPSENPTGPASGSLHVLRGGVWLNQRLYLRTAYRLQRPPSSRHVHNGFRCAHDVGK